MRHLLFSLLTLLPVATLADAHKAPLWPNADYDPAIPSIEDVLGYEMGARITHPADVLRYFEALQEAAPDRIVVRQYATSWQHRPLIYAVVSSADNIGNLEDVQAGMQALGNPGATSRA